MSYMQQCVYHLPAMFIFYPTIYDMTMLALASYIQIRHDFISKCNRCIFFDRLGNLYKI
jgi:hypothetical protein